MSSPEQTRPVQAALAENQDTFNKALVVATGYELPTLPLTELPKPLRLYPDSPQLTHARIQTYGVGGDHPDRYGYGGNELVKIHPELSVEFPIGQKATAVTIAVQVDYRPFGLEAGEFEGGTPQDIDNFFQPRTFTVYKRTESPYDLEEPTIHIYGGQPKLEIGSLADSGPIARFAAKALRASAVLLGRHSPEELLDIMTK